MVSLEKAPGSTVSSHFNQIQRELIKGRKRVWEKIGKSETHSRVRQKKGGEKMLRSKRFR